MNGTHIHCSRGNHELCVQSASFHCDCECHEMVFPTNETCACGKHVNPAKGHIARTLVDADGEISIQLIHKACKGIS